MIRQITPPPEDNDTRKGTVKKVKKERTDQLPVGVCMQAVRGEEGRKGG